MSDAPTVVDFWFDPVCPWAWITSRWVHEVTQVRDVVPRWHVMSLAILNNNPDDTSDKHRDLMAKLWRPVRVAMAAADKHGDDVLGPLYTAFGNHLHVGKEPIERATLEAALIDAGLEPDLAAAADSTDFDDAVRASHQQAIDLVGTDVGTPVILVDGSAVFGPVVTPIPRGEAAGQLWDGVRLLMATDGFFELKRSRDRAPQVA